VIGGELRDHEARRARGQLNDERAADNEDKGRRKRERRQAGTPGRTDDLRGHGGISCWPSVRLPIDSPRVFRTPGAERVRRVLAVQRRLAVSQQLEDGALGRHTRPARYARPEMLLDGLASGRFQLAVDVRGNKWADG
jgi:hypothetical protein